MKVILVCNSLFRYRELIYNYFISKFQEEGIVFKIAISEKWQKPIELLDESHVTHLNGKTSVLYQYLKTESPDVIINFLHPTNLSIWVLYFYTKLKRIPNIYWNHGVNLQDPDNKLKKKIYSYLHSKSDAIILYSKNEIKYVNQNLHKKVFIANNTIDFSSIPDIASTKEELKNKHGLTGKKVVLFVGRVQTRKRLDVLIEIFKRPEFEEYILLIVGSNFTADYKDLVGDKENIKYLGAIYEDEQINEIFKLSDLFCIPGTNGLGVNQAMYWGLPCLALDVKHSPEVIYIENEVNGFIVKNQDELAERILYLLGNDLVRGEFSDRASSHIRLHADINVMFKGFSDAVKFVTRK